MGRSTRVLLSMVVGLSLAAPTVAFGKALQRGGGSGSSSSGGQAVPRTDPPSSGSSGGGSSSSGGGSSSSGGGSSSSGGSSSGGGESRTSPPPPPPQSSNAERRAPTSSGSKTGSTAKSRTGSTSSSGTSSGGGTNGATAGVAGSNVGARDRNGRPISGVAVPRPAFSTIGGIASYPLYGYYYAPWYGFGWNVGFAAFNPYYYYGAPGWGPYGLWYDPYSYYPYDPYYASSYSTTEDTRSSRSHVQMGSLRVKASPSTAKVYVDGTLMGVVDDFDGLSHHLELEPGAHRVELRAEGYTTAAKDVTVTDGTATIRFDLKKK